MTSSTAKAKAVKDTELERMVQQTVQKLEAFAEDKHRGKKVFTQLATNPTNSSDKAYLFQHQQFALVRVKNVPGAMRDTRTAYGEMRGVLTAEGGEGEVVAFDLFTKGELDALGELLPYIKNDVAIINLAKKSGA
ncbi:uncharacterized protein BKCO1_2700023 [Diplodia corticola]|uniref:Uncharacterized protein n=1 Tax=Diplodia corticola TaxID=236234 RepID=A0A1J9RMH3_9PEZI|nr:uncharacterized protein BKCO1_2700023 [Diplodia corticola]OJD33779.1 hypothetical protein BKCO1_2700023 [Diplodia corticola]